MPVPSPEFVAERLAQRAWLEHPALPGRTNHLRAGVAVPLRWGPDGLEVLLTLRPRHLRRHGGEISLPGGGPEPGDVDLEATARRELTEETGAAAQACLGRLSSMPVYTSDWRLEPFVLAVGEGELRPDPVEVERVLPLPLGPYLASGRVEGLIVPRFQGLLTMPVFRADGLVVFGATALVLLELLHALRDEPPDLVPGDLAWAALLTDKAWAVRDPGWFERSNAGGAPGQRAR